MTESYQVVIFDHRTDAIEAAGFKSIEEAETWIDQNLGGNHRHGARDPDDATGRYEVVDRRPL